MRQEDEKFETSINKRTRLREFINENLQNEDGVDESRKRKTSETFLVQDKRMKYDDESDSYSRCKFCRQRWRKAEINCFDKDDILDSRKEEIILGNENLNIISDEKPQVKLTVFSVYDEKKHLCPFDNDILKDGVKLYAAGYVKPIHTENSDPSGGVPIRKIGPILSWWITGFDSGEKAILGLSTDVADYYLMKPSPKYEPYLKEILEKMVLIKLVIEFLKETEESEATYDNLLQKLHNTVPPPGYKTLSEDILLKYADFIYDHVMSYDETADAADRLFENTPCMNHLAELAGISVDEGLPKEQVRHRNKTPSWVTTNYKMTKAATTNLVGNVFESFFPGQIDSGLKKFKAMWNIVDCYVKLTRCDLYLQNDVSGEEDQTDDSSSVIEISPPSSPPTKKRAVAKNKSNDRSKTASVSSKGMSVLFEKTNSKSCNGNEGSTSNPAYGKPFTILLESWTDEMIEKYMRQNESKKNAAKRRKGKYDFRGSQDVRISFIDEPVLVQGDQNYFREVRISTLSVKVGDYVAVEQYDESSNRIGRVIYLLEDDDKKLFHIHWLATSTNTILGQIGNSQELFETANCDDLPINMIEDVVKVTYLPIDGSSFLMSGNASFDAWQNSLESKNEDSFFYQKFYNSEYCRFEDVKEVNLLDKNRPADHCPFCERNYEIELSEKPTVSRNPEFDQRIKQYSHEYVRWRNEEFKVGSYVFIKPGTLFQKRTNENSSKSKIPIIDEVRYPEMYRKYRFKGSRPRNNEIAEPFEIGYIVAIFSTKKTRSASDISLTVKKLYRPQDTHLDEHIVKPLDLNLLYWSNEETVISFSEVEGKCYVVNAKNLPCTVEEWTAEGPNRFYYKEAYVSEERNFIAAPTTISVNRENKNAGSRNKLVSEKIIEEVPCNWPSLSKPLRSLDIFAGCGGLTEGLHQAGIADCCWAIEKEKPAADAFRLNYPNAVVLTEDCNDLLKLMMNGQTRKDGKALPQKGEVELLCGGPPCQGFSRMNRFNDREYSWLKNSLIASFLSYVDYFRPRYVVMENVRNFVFFKNNEMIKLTLKCLVKMGYQCTFGVVQAGHYGVPQNRRRTIVFAAAPGEILPSYPEPITSFEENALTICIDNQKISTNIRWEKSAPYRKLTVFDAISDLPAMKNGGERSSVEMPYKHEAKAHFQRMMRESNDIIRDHVSKTVNPLVEKRISFIPKVPDSDWRDLPNIVVQLSDGSYTKKLVYTHHFVKNGKAENGSLRGVCSCHAGKRCDPKWKQDQTLIPWCLPHTANRNIQWDGLYGRIHWDSHFKTVITNLDPMCKQGRVLHPEQDRVVSVRELARSQGFPDKFRFCGNTQDRYRQIGNAVPPPLAAALGRQIAKAVADAEKLKKKD